MRNRRSWEIVHTRAYHFEPKRSFYRLVSTVLTTRCEFWRPCLAQIWVGLPLSTFLADECEIRVPALWHGPSRVVPNSCLNQQLAICVINTFLFSIPCSIESNRCRPHRGQQKHLRDVFPDSVSADRRCCWPHRRSLNELVAGRITSWVAIASAIDVCILADGNLMKQQLTEYSSWIFYWDLEVDSSTSGQTSKSVKG